MEYGEKIPEGNLISDKTWKKIIEHIKKNTRPIPAGTNFFKYDGTVHVLEEGRTCSPSFGLAYLHIIKNDLESAYHSGVLERPCMEKIEELERRGYNWEQIRNGEI